MKACKQVHGRNGERCQPQRLDCRWGHLSPTAAADVRAMPLLAKCPGDSLRCPACPEDRRGRTWKVCGHGAARGMALVLEALAQYRRLRYPAPQAIVPTAVCATGFLTALKFRAGAADAKTPRPSCRNRQRLSDVWTSFSSWDCLSYDLDQPPTKRCVVLCGSRRYPRPALRRRRNTDGLRSASRIARCVDHPAGARCTFANSSTYRRS